MTNQIRAGISQDPISLILRGQITPEQQVRLDVVDTIIQNLEVTFVYNNEAYLEMPVLRAFIAANWVTAAQVQALSKWVGSLFEFYPEIMQALLVSRAMTWEQVQSISEQRSRLLSSSFMSRIIQDKKFYAEQVILCPERIIENLSNRVVQEGVQYGSWSFAQALSFTPQEISYINRYGVPREIYGTPEWEEFERINRFYRYQW